MTQAYSDPTRADDPHALPNIEVFYMSDQFSAQDDIAFSHIVGYADAGWYWWACFPGCLPDGDPIGPFHTEADALADAQDID